jgi:hypothetical protein
VKTQTAEKEKLASVLFLNLCFFTILFSIAFSNADATKMPWTYAIAIVVFFLTGFLLMVYVINHQSQEGVTMKHNLIFACILILAASVLNAEDVAHCRVSLGVQMPKDVKGTTSLTLYFKPPFERPPVCVVDFGEAQFSTVNSGYAVLGGRQNSRVDFTCLERKP